jgi:hypothetical protein
VKAGIQLPFLTLFKQSWTSAYAGVTDGNEGLANTLLFLALPTYVNNSGAKAPKGFLNCNHSLKFAAFYFSAPFFFAQPMLPTQQSITTLMWSKPKRVFKIQFRRRECLV